jgi:hypothetical protein
MPIESGPRPPPPSASLTPHNPYAPPASGGAPEREPAPESRRDGGRPFGQSLKWIYAGAAVAELIAIAGLVVEAGRPAARVMEGLSTLAFWAGSITALVWLRGAWRARPFPRAHREISPWGAVGRLFLPFYGPLYWMFAANLELAASVERFPFGNRNGRGPLDLANLAMAIGALQLLAFGTVLLTARFPSPRGFYLAVLLGTLRTGARLYFLFTWERRRALVVSE